jgi:hypothetical protein
MDMCPFTDDDWDSLPHVTLTLETLWDLQVLDLEQFDDPNWFEHADDPPLLNPDFDGTAHGNYCHCIAQHAATLTTDDKTPDDDHRDYYPSTWAPLTEDALDGIVASCILEANLHQFVHAGRFSNSFGLQYCSQQHVIFSSWTTYGGSSPMGL